MVHWKALARAARQEQAACRVAVVDGPAPMLGTHMVVRPFGEMEGIETSAAEIKDLRYDLMGVARQSIADGRPRLVTVGDLRVFTDPVLPPPQLLVAGAGHVAAALAPAALAAGFRVTVVDDRSEYAQPERFPGCAVLCEEMAAVIQRLHTDATTFIVLAGRSHEKDKEALRAAVQQPAAYLGMVGSRRKVATLQKELLDAGEATVWAMEQLRAPIGLDIGAETPAEIAVAIVAELVAVRRGGSGVPLSKAGRSEREAGVPAGTLEGQRVWLALADALAQSEPCALATIVSVRGSTPRSAGACMLVKGDGTLVGSVGGGKWEAEIRRVALAAQAPGGRPVLLAPEYLNDMDMICGGAAEVFIEPLIRR
ncbi:MAG TPA: XdhC family protein [Symbiobacteriaceae bacterium]|nr:XdhC family protein [Symbiobacteriaceae bacterium]